MTEHEHRLVRAVRILLNWARKHDGITPPFPVFHPYMSRVDGAHCPRWRVPQFSNTNVTMESSLDGEELLIATAESLVRQDKDLDPDGNHDPHEVAVWCINIPTWGFTQYVATEAEAEEWRRHKARSERAAGSTKRRLTGATPQEKARYKHVGPHHLE